MPTITGSITQVPADTSHTEPASHTISGSFGGGGVREIQIGRYQNMGNVNQTVTFTSISNATNATLSTGNPQQLWEQQVGGSVTTAAVTLVPSKYADLTLYINLPTQNPGAAQQTFNFDVNVTWS